MRFDQLEQVINFNEVEQIIKFGCSFEEKGLCGVGGHRVGRKFCDNTCNEVHPRYHGQCDENKICHCSTDADPSVGKEFDEDYDQVPWRVEESRYLGKIMASGRCREPTDCDWACEGPNNPEGCNDLCRYGTRNQATGKCDDQGCHCV